MSEFAGKRIAIVAALEREVRPLVKGWSVAEKMRDGKTFRVFENGDLAVMCAGIGAEAARRGAEAVISLWSPEIIFSVGFAGALDSGLHVGDILQPRCVLSAADGSSIQLDRGSGVLISFASVASPEQKAKLRESYSAQAVDMEASSVARAAELRGVRFAVAKVISDEHDFDFPAVDRFVDSEGRFSETRFALFALCRPWLWTRIMRLARSSALAAASLANWLQKNVLADAAHDAEAHPAEAGKH